MLSAEEVSCRAFHWQSHAAEAVRQRESCEWRLQLLSRAAVGVGVALVGTVLVLRRR